MTEPRAWKRYGQHFLEPAWADRLVDRIGPQPDERFLEIGPGPGVLTLRLAARCAHVTAIEIDRRMIEALAPRVPSNVRLITGDVLDMDLAALADPAPVRVAGNLPYNVSSPVLFALLKTHQHQAPWTDATLMLQREVAERIVADVGGRDYGVLSILLQLHADASIVLTLPPGS